MKIRFLKNNIKNAPFVYKPRYYDERKENLKNKIAFFKDGDNDDQEEETDSLQSQNRSETMRSLMRQNWKAKSRNNSFKPDKNYTVRIVVLVLILVVLVWSIFYYGDKSQTETVKNLW